MYMYINDGNAFYLLVARMRSQWNEFSMEHVFVPNALQLARNFGVPFAFPQRSILRSICIPLTRSLLGYFCPVLYLLYTHFIDILMLANFFC